jgi:hypothetical protein
MFNCERCGAGYSPIRAAILEFCPRCWARDQVRVPLVVKVVRGSADGPPRAPGDLEDHRRDPRTDYRVRESSLDPPQQEQD